MVFTYHGNFLTDLATYSRQRIEEGKPHHMLLVRSSRLKRLNDVLLPLNVDCPKHA